MTDAWLPDGTLNDLAAQPAFSGRYQPLDGDLTAIAAVASTATGRSLLAAADAAGIRTIAAAAPLANPAFTGSVAVPAPTASTHVPRLARTPSASTGDLGLPGFAGSDTGWRNVTSLLVNGWTMGAGTFQIRRVGQQIFTFFENFAVDGTAATDGLVLTIPSGFRSPNTHTAVRYVSGPVGKVSSYSNGSFGPGVFGAGIAFNDTPTWITYEGWPASLPGTQATAPVSW